MNAGQPGPPDPGNVLFEAGEHGAHDETACMDLLGVSDPAVDVLFVTFTSAPGDRLDAWKRHADAPPANVGVVSVEVGGTTTGDRFAGEDGPTVLGVSDPSDLTGVGIAVSEVLSEWRDHETPTVVCFESVTALLQYVDSERVFQFLNELTAKFEAAGASAHFHITSEAHETQTLGVLSSLFDGRVSAADLGYASGSADGSDGAADRAGAATDDGTDARASDTDPFEYADGADEPEPAIVDTAETPASDGAADGDRDDAAAPPDGDPASAVSSVLDDDAAAPADDEDGRSAGASGARGSGAADADPDAHSGTPGPADGSDPAADSAGRNFGRRKSTSTDDTDDAPADDASRSGDASGHGGGAARPSAPGSAPESTGSRNGGRTGRLPSRSVLYQRTVATVVGVVVMLLLIGVVTSAMPIPLGADSPAVGPAADATETPTPASTSTTTPTPSPTAEPTETDTRTQASTATATPAPT